MTHLGLRRNRKCLSDGLLRAVVENEVDRDPDVTAHLDNCPRCRERLDAMLQDHGRAGSALQMLQPEPPVVDAGRARRRLAGMIESTDSNQRDSGETFVNSLWNSRAARGAVAMLALVLLTTAFVATPMRSLADGLFNRFEVQKFEAITVGMDDVSGLQITLLLGGMNADHERLLSAAADLAEVETTFDQENPENSLSPLDSYDAAREAFGPFQAPTDLPAGFDDTPEMAMTQAGSASVTVNTASANTIVEELNLPIESLPNATEMPEMVFGIDIPSALLMHFKGSDDGHLAIAQLESPTLTTPEGLDMDALRDDVLSMPGLSADLVDQLKAVDDWHNTLIVPVPEGAETRDVTIAGEAGLLIEAGAFDGSQWGIDFQIEGDASVVMWSEDGVLYLVAGTLDGDTLVDVAESLQ